MTRINVGVDPSELCDQHLIAEYRELPRLWNLKTKTVPPLHFKLGTGHVLWCAQYQGMLADRYILIVKEMKARGFQVSYPNPPDGKINGLRPTNIAIETARNIVLQRLNEKYNIMKRPPKWTKQLKK